MALAYDEQEQLNDFKNYFIYYVYMQYSHDGAEIKPKKTDWHVMYVIFGNSTFSTRSCLKKQINGNNIVTFNCYS